MTIPNALVLARLKEDAGMQPIVCVGESLEQREQGVTASVIETQVRIALNGVAKEQMRKIVIAYEPIWAIGTGKTATAEQAAEVCTSLKIMRDAIVDISLLNQADFVLAPLGERLPPDRFPAEGYNEAVYAFLSDLIDFLTGCGGLVMCCLKMSGEYHLFLAGNSANLADGTLYDVIPTFLDLAGLSKPDDMKGTSLII